MNIRESKIEYTLPLLAYENNMLISKSSDITRLFRVKLKEAYTISQTELNNSHIAWCKAIRCLPDYCIVHKQDIFQQKKYKGEKTNGQKNFLQIASDKHFVGREYIDHQCYVYVTLATQDSFKSKATKNAILRKNLVAKENLNKDTINNFNDSVEQFKSVLMGSGFFIEDLTEDEVIGTDKNFGLIEKYLTLNFSGENEIMYDIHTEEKDLMIGDKYVSLFSLSELTELPPCVSPSIRNNALSTDQSTMATSMAFEFGLQLPFDHIYNQYFFLDDSAKNLVELEKQGRKMESLSAISRENAINKQFNEEYLNEVQIARERSIHCAFNIIVWDELYTNLLKKNASVASSLSLADCNATKTEVIVPHLFWSGIPGNSANYPTEMRFITFVGQGACFLNFESNANDITGEERLGLRLTDRLSGKPLRIDLSEQPMKNKWASAKNKFILGPSGSGKSFFTNVMVAQKYAQGDHIVIVDVGDSYLGLCQLINEQTNGQDGIYYTYTEEKPIAFNPFFSEDYVYTEEKMTQLLSLICVLWKNEDEPVTRAEETHVETALNLYVRIIKDNRNIYPDFNSFFQFLCTSFKDKIEEENVEKKDFDIDNLIQVLTPYAKGGKYDYLLNSREKIDLLHKRFIVFELDNIKDHKILFPIVTIVLMDTFIAKMRRLQPHERKMILIEEAWKAISKSGTAEFIKYLYKTVRKHNGEVAVVTQEVDDIVGNEIVKNAIINNADIKILLDQSKFLNRFNEIESTLALSADDKALVLSVNRAINHNRPPYKEVFISFGTSFSSVYGVEVSREEYLAFSTTKEEKGLVLQYAKEEGSMEKGIKKYISKHYKK